jgi:PqqD family protein of HPr-rel-A system
MSASATSRWRAADSRLVWRHWEGEDEWVVYSPRSGDVHLLNPAAHALLHALSSESLTADELVRRLAAAAGRPPDQELSAAVATSLASLDEAGLVEPQRP